MDISKYRIDLPKRPSKGVADDTALACLERCQPDRALPATYSGKFHHGDAADRGWVLAWLHWQPPQIVVFKGLG